MRLVSDWKPLLQKAWSIRLMLLSFLFSALEVGLPLIDGLYPIPPGLFAAMSAITAGAAPIARLLMQTNLPETKP